MSGSRSVPIKRKHLTRRAIATGRRDRGAVLVEFALVIPVLAAIVLGVVEYGNAYRQVNSIEHAVQQAARTASVQADGRFADYEALRTVSSAVGGLQGVEIDWVSIYEVTGSNGDIPNACRSGDVNGLCNHYTGTQTDNISLSSFPGGATGSPSCAGGIDSAFCPVTDRHRTTEPPTVIGVHMSVTYIPVTGLWPGPTVTIERNAVFQVEPCSRGVSTC